MTGGNEMLASPRPHVSLRCCTLEVRRHFDAIVIRLDAIVDQAEMYAQKTGISR